MNVWAPATETGLAEGASAQAEALSRHHDVRRVVEAGSGPEADLDLYHVADTRACAFVCRAALERPGVLQLHDWSLHQAWPGLADDRDARQAYLREMQRRHGEDGEFVGGQVLRGGAGALLPDLYPANEWLLEASLAVVGPSRALADAAARQLRDRPVLWLPPAVSLPIDAPPRDDARAALGLDPSALVVTAPGRAAASSRLDVAIRALGPLRRRFPKLVLVVAGEVAPELPLAHWSAEAGLGDALRVVGRASPADLVRHLSASDVVLALHWPARGRIPDALVPALGLGRPVLVSGATPAADDFPEGVVVPVDPGRDEAEGLSALLAALLADEDLRARIGRLAAAHVRSRHDLASTTATLAQFLVEAHAHKPELEALVAAARVPDGSLLDRLLDEVGAAARELGLRGVPPDIPGLVRPLG